MARIVSGSLQPNAFKALWQRSEWGLLFAIVAVVLLATALDSQHNYFKNPKDSAVNILRQTSMLGIFALGTAVVIIAGGIDLSSGSVIAFSGTICGTILLLLAPATVGTSQPLGVGFIVLACTGTLFAGLLIGTLHTWLITVVQLPPFIATLATLVGLRSLSRAIVAYVNKESTQINLANTDFRYIATSIWIPAVLCGLLAISIWLLMSRTVVGRHLYALGGNETAARLSGIQTDRMKWLAYSISAVLSSLAGIIHVAEVATIEPETLGKGYELNAIAAAVVGGCSLQGGVGTIPGTILGTLFLRVVMDAVDKVIKVSADVYEGLIVGSVVVVAVALTQLRQAARHGQRFFPGVFGVISIVALSILFGVLVMLFAQKTALGGNMIGGVAAVGSLALMTLVAVLQARRDKRGREKNSE